METSLSHLPSKNQKQLELLKETILKNIPDATIVLFGSFARDTWVEEYHETSEYVSDYDLLVVTEEKTELGEFDLQKILRKEVSSPSPSVIMHTKKFINGRLKRGSYFFVDIVDEGIILHDSKKFTLAKFPPPNPEERKKHAKQDFEYWFGSGNEFLDIYFYALQKGKLNKAAFNLHQTVESYFSAVLLVFTNYKPRTHDLTKLINECSKHDEVFQTIFPSGTEEQRQSFTLLNKAYVSARYDRDYRITKEQLEYLAGRVEILKETMKKVCERRIDAI